MQNETLPTIAITTGDPAGIGPEVVLKALEDRESIKHRSLAGHWRRSRPEHGGKADWFEATRLYRPRWCPNLCPMVL